MIHSRPSPKPDDEEGSLDLPVFAESSGRPQAGLHRTEDRHRRSADVRQGGPHLAADEHVLRLHRDQGTD